MTYKLLLSKEFIIIFYENMVKRSSFVEWDLVMSGTYQLIDPNNNIFFALPAAVRILLI